jgi:hypothetical protein
MNELALTRVKILSLAVVLFLTGCAGGSRAGKKGTAYFVDSQSGDDRYSGTSPRKPLKSLSRIRELKLYAGDQIYLSGSSHFQGSLKLTDVEGSKELPVVLTSYGEGQPVIESGDSLGILAQDCKYLKIKNITVSGSGRLRVTGLMGSNF